MEMSGSLPIILLAPFVSLVVKRGKLEMAVMEDLAFGCPLVDVSVGGSGRFGRWLLPMQEGERRRRV